MVPMVGVEPTLLSQRDFESRVYTNFTTQALSKLFMTLQVRFSINML